MDDTLPSDPSICLVGYYLRKGTFTYPWSQYRDVYEALAAADARVAFYDHSLRLPAYDTDPDLSLMDADGIHPSDAGHAYLAECLRTFMAPQ